MSVSSSCACLISLPAAGTHRENTLAHGVNHRPPRAVEVVASKQDEAVVVPHRIGGALFYSPYTFHSSTPTVDCDSPTGRRRRIVTCFYGPMELRLPVALDDPDIIARPDPGPSPLGCCVCAML